MNQSTRVLQLITELDATLATARDSISRNEVPLDKVSLLESRLVEMHRWRSDIAGLTGPSGYDPKPSYEKCLTCGHYRIG